MSFLLRPWHILLVTICGLLNLSQQQVIEFQNAQIAALLKQPGRKRLLLDDNQRRLLAVEGQAIGRKALFKLTTIVTPDTPCADCQDHVEPQCREWLGGLLKYYHHRAA